MSSGYTYHSRDIQIFIQIKCGWTSFLNVWALVLKCKKKMLDYNCQFSIRQWRHQALKNIQVVSTRS